MEKNTLSCSILMAVLEVFLLDYSYIKKKENTKQKTKTSLFPHTSIQLMFTYFCIYIYPILLVSVIKL